MPTFMQPLMHTHLFDLYMHAHCIGSDTSDREAAAKECEKCAYQILCIAAFIFSHKVRWYCDQASNFSSAGAQLLGAQKTKKDTREKNKKKKKKKKRGSLRSQMRKRRERLDWHTLTKIVKRISEGVHKHIRHAHTETDAQMERSVRSVIYEKVKVGG